MNNMNKPILHCENVSKSFHDGRQELKILKNVNLSVQAGEQIAIIGASGSGKTTLLQVLGGLDKPTTGQVSIAGANINLLGERQRCLLRNRSLGFVYQFHHLLPEFTALENVAMPLLIRGSKPAIAREKADQLLAKVGLKDRLRHKLGQLSGGERQRVAIARALVTEPQCLLADEPTGNLDRHTADQVYETMLELNRELKTSFIIVTHNPELAAQMDRTFTIKEGELALA